MKDKNTVKIAVALVFLLIAGALLAWNAGLFGGGSGSAQPSAESEPESKQIQ